jgi:hypothetical protein
VNDDPFGGVRTTRGGKKAYSDLMGPRPTDWEDELAAERRRLLQLGASDGRAIVEAVPKGKVEHRESMARAVYRYSKGPDTLNDELGYGEVVTECFWNVFDGIARVVYRKSQRTKTGRQFLTYVEEPAPRAVAVEGSTGTPRDKAIKQALDKRVSKQKLPAQTSRPTRSRR